MERTSFVGRRRDLQALDEGFAAGIRLLTLIGPPGVGKTRLARQYAARRLEDGSESVWLVDLSSARQGMDIVEATGRALGVPLTDAADLAAAADRLGAALAASGSCLLVLDDCEHVVAAMPATVGRWLDDATELTVLVTSREKLRLRGETVVKVDALPPDDAAALYAGRARACAPDTESPDPEVLRALVEKLDRLPLAIELAAARSDVLPPAVLLERLARDVDVLRIGPRDAPAHQRTLEQAIDRSWALLSQAERSVLARCSVFRGGIPLELVEQALDGPVGTAVVDVLEGLVHKSLLQSRHGDGEARFVMYDSVRMYAERRLQQSGCYDEMVRRYVEVYERAAERWAVGTRGPDAAACMAALARDRANLMHAHRHAVAQDPERAVAILQALDAVLSSFGPLDPLETAADETLRALGDAHPRAPRARALRAKVLWFRGQLEAAAEQLEWALAGARDHADRWLEQRVLWALGALDTERERFDSAERYLQQAVEIARDSGDEVGEVSVLNAVGLLARARNELDHARQTLQTAARLCERIGNVAYEGTIASNLGDVWLSQGRTAEARASLESALRALRRTGNRRSEAFVLARLGELWLQSNEPHRAVERLEQAVELFGAVGDRGHERAVGARLAEAQGFAATAAERRGEVLRLTRDGRWARLPDGDTLGLERRRALRRVLVHLAEHHERSPGVGSSVHELVAAGWPGERMQPQSGADRVYAAVRTLRKLGLRTLLQTRDDGYLLSPSVRVDWVDSGRSFVETG